MTPLNIQQWIQHPEMLDRDTLYELRNMIARYPYFQSLRLLYLKNLYLLHDSSFGAELRKSVLYVADRRMLFRLIEGETAFRQSAVGETAGSVCREEPDVDRTLALIDAFLATAPEEVATQKELDYSVDYTTYLLQADDAADSRSGQEAPKLKGHELIDNFIEKNEGEPSPDTQLSEPAGRESAPTDTPESASAGKEKEEEDDSCFTETLAKIYIKQRRYSKALEIIRKLSLKYPKKNAYFADQIRFLEKLIINANSK